MVASSPAPGQGGHTTRRRFLGAAGMGAGALALSAAAACGGSSSGSSGGGGGSAGPLVFGMLTTIPGLDPQRFWNGAAQNGTANIFEGLLTLQPFTSQIQPSLATDLPVASRGNTRYTFTLHDGVRFSDGTPLTSADVKYSFERLALLVRRRRDRIDLPGPGDHRDERRGQRAREDAHRDHDPGREDRRVRPRRAGQRVPARPDLPVGRRRLEVRPRADGPRGLQLGARGIRPLPGQGREPHPADPPAAQPEVLAAGRPEHPPGDLEHGRRPEPLGAADRARPAGHDVRGDAVRDDRLAAAQPPVRAQPGRHAAEQLLLDLAQLEAPGAREAEGAPGDRDGDRQAARRPGPARAGPPGRRRHLLAPQPLLPGRPRISVRPQPGQAAPDRGRLPERVLGRLLGRELLPAGWTWARRSSRTCRRSGST